MAHPGLRAVSLGLAIALVPATSACDRMPGQGARSSVTVKLPPPRPAVPAPGFNFEQAPDGDATHQV